MILESELQSKIIKKLTLNGYFVVKIIQTNRNGWPDLQAVKDGKTIYIEVKREGEKPDQLQKYVHGHLRNYGAEVYVIDNINDIEKILSQK